MQWVVPMPVRVSSSRSLLSQQTWTNDVPDWMFDGTNTSFSELEDLCAISCCAIPASTSCICVADRPCPKRFKSDTTFALPEMCFMARGSPICLAVFMRPRVTQWIMSCATERTLQRSDSEASSTFSCRERPCDALSPRRSHARKLKSVVGTWALAAWSLISVGLGGKGILVAPSITFEWRHKAALNKVGPGDSSNSSDSASISIDAAVSLKLSKVFSALAHFSTIGSRETLLLKTYSNTFRCCGRWKVKALPKCWMSLVLSRHVR